MVAMVAMVAIVAIVAIVAMVAILTAAATTVAMQADLIPDKATTDEIALTTATLTDLDLRAPHITMAKGRSGVQGASIPTTLTCST